MNMQIIVVVKKIFILVVVVFIVINCQNSLKSVEFKTYDGPIAELEHVTSYYSDSAFVYFMLRAPLQYEYIGGDREYLKGVFVEFYGKEGNVVSTLRSNKAEYNAKEGIYIATGDVEIKQFERKQTLNTEELYWDMSKQKIFTEKFVRIETEEELIMGEGLEAEQNLSSYEIKKTTGVIVFDN